MFDALTINFVLVILTSVYFFMSIIIYVVRREKYLLYYLLAFLTLAITYIMLFFQKSFPDWFSFIVMNLFIALSQIFIVAAIRVFYKLKPIESRIIIYLFILICALLYFTYFNFSLSFRIISLSLYMAIYLLDLLWIIKKHSANVHANINKVVKTIITFSSLIWLSRIIFALSKEVKYKYLVDQGGSTVIYYLIAMISVSIWFSLFIWLDSKKSVIELEQKNNELSELALVDKLTNLSNRHYFDREIEFLIATSIRKNSKISMFMIDLDRFKSVNDTFGHIVGDNVLKQSAQILKNSVRTTDRVYRWGGEEFIVITPETNNSQASIVAEKICQNFRDAKFDVIGNITVSVGCATYNTNESISDWLIRIDLSLYKAKQTGRNKWIAWIDDEELPNHFNRFEWSTDFESGNTEVDNDHKLLVEYINLLHDQIVENYPIDTIHEFIQKMSKHIQIHFAREEAILLNHKYSEYSEHRSIHKRILSEYEILLKKAISGNISLGALMSYLVEKVLLQHILEDDKKFFNIIK